jgi:hypothetical protein
MTGITITREQAKALFDHTGTLAAFLDRLAESGITIAPPSPSPEMVKLARDAVIASNYIGDCGAWSDGYLAALQHFEELVKAADDVHYAGLIGRSEILRVIGSDIKVRR